MPNYLFENEKGEKVVVIRTIADRDRQPSDKEFEGASKHVWKRVLTTVGATYGNKWSPTGKSKGKGQW